MQNRHKRIGASEIGAIAGISKWATPLDIYERKLGLSPEFEGNVFTEMGHELEPIVARQFIKRRPEFELHDFMNEDGSEVVLYHPDYPFIGVQPDRGLLLGGKMVGNLECKTTVANWDAESIPLDYFSQAQFQAGIMRLNGYPIEEVYIAVLKSYYDFFYGAFSFDEEYFQTLVDLAVRFWEDHVLKEVPPPPSNSADLLKMRTPTGGDIVIDSDAYSILNELASIKSSIKELEEHKEELEEALKMIFQEKDTMIFDGSVVATWKEQNGRSSIDTKRLQDEYPEIYKELFRVGSPIRVLRLKI